MKLIVIGAGIAASCVARLAQERDWETEVIAGARKPDSLAATAIMRRAYHAGKPEELEAWDFAVATYERWGIKMERGGEVASYRRPLGGEKQDADWLLMDPAAPLLKPDVKREVVSVFGKNAWFGKGAGVSGHAVVAACGAVGSLAPSGDVTWGVTWLHSPDALKHPSAIKVYQYAPYRTIVAGLAGKRARVGSSSSVSEEGAVEQGRKMLKMAWDLGWITTMDDWEMRLGARVKTPDHWRRADDGHWEIGGFHRTGYALAPMAAQQLLDDIAKEI